MGLQDTIDACIETKVGDKSFIIRSDDDGATWEAGIGNPSRHVALGEVEPEIFASGDTVELAVNALYAQLVQCEGEAPPPPDPRTPAERRFDEMMDGLTDAEFIHIQDCMAEAFPAEPGEILGRMLRASMIMSSSITAESLKLSARELGLIEPARITGQLPTPRGL